MPEFNKHRFVSDMSESVFVRTISNILNGSAKHSQHIFTGNDRNNFTILVLITNQLTNLLCTLVLYFLSLFYTLYIYCRL